MMFGKHLMRDFQDSCCLVFVLTNKSIWEWFDDDRCLHWVPRKERGIEDPNDLFRLALAISRTNRVRDLSSTNVALAIDQCGCFSARSTIPKRTSLLQKCYRPNVGGEDILSKAASVCPLTDKSVYRGAEMSPAGAPGCWPTLRSLRRESWTLAPRLSGFWSLEDRCGLHHRRDI